MTMNEKQAAAIAKALDGEEWQSGGDMWLVTLNRADGHLIVFSEEAVSEYESDEAFDAGKPPLRTIELPAATTDQLWVVQDEEGTVFLREPDLGLGWRWREDAEQEASGIHSRTGLDCFVREQRPEDTKE